MPFPHYPRKHREAALFKASDFHRYALKRPGVRRPKSPPNIILVYGARWRDFLRKKFRGRLDPYTGVYRVSRSVGIAHVEGPGAPFSAIVVEELVPLGVKRFLIVGIAGSLQPTVRVGALVVCQKALRDEGTSHHYAKPGHFARPSPRLVAKLKRTIERHHVPFFEGASWTTDAPYRETVAEVRRYRRAGILTVEMEAAAVFTVAQHLGCESAALFVVSDNLDESGWEPRFHDTRGGLRKALDIAIECSTS